MAARSTGVYPREGFNLDEETRVLAVASGTAAPGGITLKHAKTIRVIVVGLTGVDNAGTNKLTVTLGGQAVDFNARDLDANGVGIAHVRGALCDTNNEAFITKGGTAAIGTAANAATGVFLELVDGPRR